MVHIPWTAEGEIDALRAFDIGMVPLGSSDFDRGKFPFKMLQFMALGLPVVASRIGTPSEVIADGVSGFLAESSRDWLDALKALVQDPALRGRVGRAGRALLETQYTVEVVAPKFLQELRAVETQPARR